MFKIINQSDTVITETLTALIYGEPGIGKTSLAFTSDNALMLDFDGGLQRACHRQTAVRIEKWEDVIDLQKSKELKELAPKTLIIDTAGAMLDVFLADYVKKVDPKNTRRGGELSLQGYGALKSNFEQFLNWAKSMHCNLIFITHSATMDEGDNTKFIPKITGGSSDILRQSCDLIGYMSSYKNKRVLDFNPTDNHIGKNCSEFDIIEIPNYTNVDYQDFFQQLINKTLEKMNSLSEMQTKVLEKINEFKNGLDLLEDLESVKTCLSGIQKEESRPVQLQMFSLLKNKAKELGFNYNSETKDFENAG